MMRIPSVAVGLHDRYTPKIRDRIIEKLQAPTDQAAHHLLTLAHLRSLAATESPDRPVISFYLQLSPERRAGGAWQSVWSSLASETSKAIRDRRKRRMVEEEFDRIESVLNEALPESGSGVAFFTCRATRLWQQIAVSVPVPDGVHCGRRPYVRPLVRARDEHDRFVLALLSQEHSRFFISQIGQVEGVLQIKGERSPGRLAERVALAQGGVVLAEPVNREARALAEVARLVMAQFEGRHLLISAPPEMRTADLHAGAAESRRRPSRRSGRSRRTRRSLGSTGSSRPVRTEPPRASARPWTPLEATGDGPGGRRRILQGRLALPPLQRAVGGGPHRVPDLRQRRARGGRGRGRAGARAGAGATGRTGVGAQRRGAPLDGRARPDGRPAARMPSLYEPAPDMSGGVSGGAAHASIAAA
jgi:hypothetical protein